MELIGYCDKIVDKLAIANFSNMLTIADQLDCNNAGKGFPVESFLWGMLQSLSKKYVAVRDGALLAAIRTTEDYYKKRVLFKGLNLRNLMEGYLIELWMESHQWR